VKVTTLDVQVGITYSTITSVGRELVVWSIFPLGIAYAQITDVRLCLIFIQYWMEAWRDP